MASPESISHRRCRQGIVPDYILRSLAECESVDNSVRQSAKRTLEQLEGFLKRAIDTDQEEGECLHTIS